MFCRICWPRLPWIAILTLLCSTGSRAQQSSPPATAVSKILDRLDELERQNKELLSEIQALREEVEKANASPAKDAQSVADKTEVTEQRVNELAQTKVEASQRFPISLTGMLLFDSFVAKGTDSPAFQEAYGAYLLGAPGGGATLRESIIGFDFRGPQIFGNGRINGFLSMDFYGMEDSAYTFRIRRGGISFDWKNRSLIFGQDKSIIAPLQPTSFARVGVPPLAGAGNLWLWQPQVTYQERVPISKSTRATLEGSVFETNESYTLPYPASDLYSLPNRPALQARAQLEHDWSDSTKIAAGVAGDGSSTHILGQSIPSRVISADFLVKPVNWVELSGTLLHGKNFANLGGVPGGVRIDANHVVVPIRGSAGWLQLAFPATKRLTFDVYTGKQVNDARDLSAFEVLRSETFAGNVLYRVAPNVMLGLEAARNRVEYLNQLTFWVNRYDATVAYLF